LGAGELQGTALFPDVNQTNQILFLQLRKKRCECGSNRFDTSVNNWNASAAAPAKL
jgi:hypothetical protein